MIVGRGRCTPVTGRRGRQPSSPVWAITGRKQLQHSSSSPLPSTREADVSFYPAASWDVPKFSGRTGSKGAIDGQGSPNNKLALRSAFSIARGAPSRDTRWGIRRDIYVAGE